MRPGYSIGEEVAGDEVGEVILEERFPRLRGRLSTTRHQPGDRALRDVEAQLEELAVDSGRAPERVGERHLLDEGSQLQAHRRTPWPSTSRLPGPEGAEPLPMPADDGLWPKQAQRIAPARPALRKAEPEAPGDSSELRPLGRLRRRADCCRSARFSSAEWRRDFRAEQIERNGASRVDHM